MGLLSPAPALINQALLLAVVGNWSISAAASTPPLPPQPLPPPSLPIQSGPRLQCFFSSYFWPMQGSRGESGSQSRAHPLQLLFLSVAAGRRDSIKSSVYSALRLHQGPLSEHTSPPTPKPSPKPYTHPGGLLTPSPPPPSPPLLPPAHHSLVVLPHPFFFSF